MIDTRMKRIPSPALLIAAAGAAMVLPGMCGTTRPMHFELPIGLPAIGMVGLATMLILAISVAVISARPFYQPAA